MRKLVFILLLLAAGIALISAAGVSGNILRLPYQRIYTGEAIITLKIENNGYEEEISYTFSDPIPETTHLKAIYPNPSTRKLR